MKQLFTTAILLLVLHTAFSQANTTLSNLVAPTAANADLLPGVNNSKNLGSSIKGWKYLYLTGELRMDGYRFLSNAPDTTAFNTFVGTRSGIANTTGTNNTAVGHKALFTTTSGQRNTAT